MYLKKLEMQGFKSFVDKISLDFGNGITAIVGPNGSGKSNISDAIRWVMGEQSIKSLRGSKMEDVIFAGTEKRKPTGFAEVSLCLDNSTGIFPIDYNEVTVTRRIYRSGESEYFINKAICRLRDIHELFMDTGLGRDGYSIIGQGKIDEIISGKPEDRRRIFEEAAGISKYKYKKAEAEKKLAAAEDNLSRVTDIAGELEGRVEPLKKQSEKALKYIALRDEFKVLDINLALNKFSRLSGDREKLQNDFSVLIKNLEEETETLQKCRADEETAFKLLRESEGEFRILSEQLHAAELSKEKINGEISLLKSSIEQFETEIKNGDEEIRLLNEELLRLDGEKENQKKCVEEIEKEKKAVSDGIESENKKHRELSQKSDSINEKLRLAANEESELMRNIDLLKARLGTIDALESDFDGRRDSIEKEISEAENAARDAADSLDKLKSSETEIIKNKKEKKDESEKLRQDAEEKKILLSELKEAYNKKSVEYGHARSRYNILSEMEKNMEGYGFGVKKLMSSDFVKTIGCHGIVSKLLKTDEKYYVAAETALAAAVQNVVVDSEEDAKAAIEFLKKNKFGRVTFLPISSVRGKRGAFEGEIDSEPGYLGVLSDKITTDKAYREIAESLLGQTALFDNIDNAVRCAKKYRYKFKIVTLAGEALFPGGSISGGSGGRNAGLFGRESEIARLNENCKKLEREMDDTENKIDDVREKIVSIGKSEESILADIASFNEELARISGEKILREHIIKRENQNALKKNEELKLLLKAGNESEKERELINSEIEKNQSTFNAKTDESEIIKAELKTVIEAKEKVYGAIERYKEKNSELNAEADMCKIRTEGFEKEIAYRTARIGRIAESSKLYMQRKNEALLNIKNKERDILESESIMKSFEDEMQKAADKKTGADKSISELKNLTVAQNERVNELNLKKARFESRAEKLEDDIDAVISSLWDSYELSINDARSMICEIGDEKEAEKRALELKSEIRALGHINLDAVDEYKEVSERYGFLTKQIEDLRKAKTELQILVEEITSSMKTQFGTQFEIISKNFTEVFKELFGGGSAEILLSDPTDILSSGIEIDVRPPGKKLQRMSLLSGGEMAFTAIALLFAILRVRPTPFCILDEIEAALDDNNIARFCSYIKKFSEKTQFIVVTHRRGTMEAADILYGVTMQEKGVSKLLSMRLDEVSFN